ncbi:TfoX/Sxy family protein [Microvirga arsenatis]|uniref:Competence-specific regulator n=1 Tax=Microvirga arsenatis TaxID=2692265 RepID=A0ABW9Z013_9HYPH|nr:TfoX/Sxy family protein [Microvirga arsenatis]NBJ12230.1 competence-specific regulator [Microvirga arsenatis]NBJ25882.1 competence-specific regulator [Microvirga arsenatis]
MSDAPLHTLPGIGPVTQGWLQEAGIRTAGELRAMGSVEAYRRLKFMLPQRVSLNALYALEAALRGCHWLDLPHDVKAALQREAKAVDAALRRGGVARCSLP